MLIINFENFRFRNSTRYGERKFRKRNVRKTRPYFTLFVIIPRRTIAFGKFGTR